MNHNLYQKLKTNSLAAIYKIICFCEQLNNKLCYTIGRVGIGSVENLFNLMYVCTMPFT